MIEVLLLCRAEWGKTYCFWLLGKDYNNIIIIYPT